MKRSRQVLLIANNFPPVRGGSSIVYSNLARGAVDRITVLAPSTSYVDGMVLIGWREHDRLATFPVHRLPLLRTMLAGPEGRWQRLALKFIDVAIRARVTAAVLKILVRDRVGAVCVGELLASRWILQMLRYVPGVRSLVYVHGEEITTHDPHGVGLAGRRRALLSADRIIVVSQFTQKKVLALLGEQHSNRILLIENGVDTTRFSPAPRNRELTERYKTEGKFVFVTVCRLLEKKGVDQALRAYALLLEKCPQTLYLMVGAGPYEAELRAIAAALQIEHAVVFAGNVPEHELVDHYRLGDVFVMPNRKLLNGDTEGFGLVFLEANACGLPVIAGQDGGSVDAVTDGDNGLVVSGHSVEAVHDAMLRLRTDEELRQRLTSQSLVVARRSDWAAKVAAFLQACDAPA